MAEENSPGETPSPPDGTARARSFRRILVPLLAAGFVIALAVAGVFVFLWLQSVDTSPEEVGRFISEEAPEIADVSLEVATLLSNYDATNIEERRQQILELAVGRFRQQYEDLLSQGLGVALERGAASSRGQVLRSPDIGFVSGSEATAIVETTQTVQSNANPSGMTFRYIMQLTLIDTPDSGWKVNEFLILSQQQET